MTDTDFWYLKKGVPIKLSKHFTSTDFDCHCKYPECTQTIVSKKLVLLLELLQWLLGRPLKPFNSAFRCARHNADPDVGGEKDSYHTKGMACDVASTSIKEKLKISKYLKNNGFGIYRTFFHVDVRGFKYWWRIGVK